MRTLIGQTVPFINAIRDYHGNVVHEFPKVRIIDTHEYKGHKYLVGVWADGPKRGETQAFQPTDLLVF